MRQVLLALALRDENVGGAEAAELADRALELARGNKALDPPAALEAAKSSVGSSPSDLKLHRLAADRGGMITHAESAAAAARSDGRGRTVPGTHVDSDQRLSLILETQRDIAAAGDELEAVMQIVAERSHGDHRRRRRDGQPGRRRHAPHPRGQRHRRRWSIDARRPIAKSIARYAIESGQPVLVEDARTDPRINQELRAKVGDSRSSACRCSAAARSIGTLNVMSSSKIERLDEEDRQTLEMLSVVLSAAVSRVAEFDARRAQAEAFARFRTLFDGASLGHPAARRRRRGRRGQPRARADAGRQRRRADRLALQRAPASPSTARPSTSCWRRRWPGTRESFALEARCTTRTAARCGRTCARSPSSARATRRLCVGGDDREHHRAQARRAAS